MNLQANETELIERYLLIENRHERLNAIVGHKFPGYELPIEERRTELLVKGCASQVWLEVKDINGGLAIRYAADSVLVKGLVALFVELYDGAEVVEVGNFSPRIIGALGLDKLLSPTRLSGLAQVVSKFHEAAHVD